ncbi:hypothetical protein MARGE09_P0591 [Marinagarivorans cellulosilyticus]|uniref:Trypsin-co-occurring domain-containing protein n=2 Tax=Marinagarivorans cellulosilyticus TaxID=2721545 RepID=A0AAN2BIZ4_9GAMM|nr:hypothetical protein MARGE09_P0591 [Marinagarivorans cellulosilyticus]
MAGNDNQDDVNGNEIPLIEVLTALREAVEEAKKGALDAQSDIRFNLDDIEVELETVVTKTTTAEGGVGAKLFVVDIKAGGKAEYSNAMKQKLTFRLSPVTKGGSNEILLSNEES